MRFSNPREILKDARIREGEHVADLGCGSGFYAIAAAERVGDTGKVYAIDIQEDLLVRVRNTAKEHRLDNIVCITSDISRPRGSTLTDGAVELVILGNVLFQVPDKKLVLTEAMRILKQKGRLLVVDWADSFGGIGPQPEHVLPERMLTELAENIGFHKVQSVHAGGHHYAVLFSKS